MDQHLHRLALEILPIPSGHLTVFHGCAHLTLSSRVRQIRGGSYDFPAQHWSHLRTTNPIESTFATVRLRTQRTKGCGSRIATLTMVFKLGTQAQQHWRRLNGSELIPKVVTGVTFVDGEELTEQAA